MLAVTIVSQAITTTTRALFPRSVFLVSFPEAGHCGFHAVYPTYEPLNT
jgi:hypothetical protein